MDASDLKVFEAVARHGGISRAAKELHTVQSNVTTRIRALEQELGTALFERHARGVTLTQAGHRLLPYTAEIRDVLARARRAATDDGTPKGPLVIGTLETTVALRLPRIIAAFVSAWPDVDLSLRTGTSAESVRRVLDRELDGAFVAGPLDHPDIIKETVFREELVIVTAASMTSLDDLGRGGALKILVLRVGCSYRQRLETLLASRGIADVRPMEFGTLDAIIGCVAAGIGITLLPRAVVVAASRAGDVTLHDLPRDEAMVETLFIRRHDALVTSANAAFLDAVRPESALVTTIPHSMAAAAYSSAVQ
ncbi:MAG TPA: LysR substrate-binding domain-containing protein [Acetobacteraceae bacterium]|jgi:DNA-binding transcriptional LysR family regulator|nr:LysR substrate-binding domain-containing protein [Acetobacteraceae bacterium]